jgi:hypothetical protein
MRPRLGLSSTASINYLVGRTYNTVVLCFMFSLFRAVATMSGLLNSAYKHAASVAINSNFSIIAFNGFWF